MSSNNRRINRIPFGLPGRPFWAGAALLVIVIAAPAGGQNATQEAATLPTAKPVSASKLTAKDTRDAKIAADAEKLYQMALDLKVEVDKSNKDTVSLTVAKRAAELEKMAKTLKQEMRAN